MIENSSSSENLSNRDYCTESQNIYKVQRKSNNQENGTKVYKKKAGPQLVVNLGDCRYPIVKKVVKSALGFKVIKDLSNIEWDLMWTDNAVQPQQLAKMKVHQKINHFPGMYSLSRKNYLARNLIKMSKEFPEEYNFYPKTWVLPSEFNELRNYLQNEPSSIVIAKPEASCQGRGIFLSKSIQDFQFGEHYVVQKYMKKPFLIDGLKFDLRIYVLVAGCDPLRVYIYKEGLARFATEPYQNPKKENLGNLFMHLTNYAINKANSKFQFNQSNTEMDKGHKRSLTSILTKLKELGHNTEKLWSEICNIITKTLISVQPILAHHYRSCQPQNYANNMCFQVLGFDVILQNNLKPSILEVNYTPSFTTDTPLDKTIKQNLIKDALILMNMTLKSKSDILNAKKRELLERTLTGKKIWHSKEEREKIIKRCQNKRNHWQNNHLGNYEKIYPYVGENIQIAQKYERFLYVSEQCYLNITGGNIKRNQKVISQGIINQTPQEDNNKKSQNLKLTKTQELEKIYVKKVKMMKPNRKILKNEQMTKYPSQSNCEGAENNRSKLQNSAKVISVPTRSNNKFIMVLKGGDRHACSTEKAIVDIDIHRRANSAKNKTGISKVYNITFKK